MKVPDRPNGWGGLLSWAKRVTEYLISRQDIRAPNVIIRETSRGVSRSALPSFDSGGTPGGSLQFRGQWNSATSYNRNDIVICETNPEMDDGNLAGDYMAIDDIPAGALRPGVPAGGTATATGTLGGGALTGTSITDAGHGYTGTTAAITITGDGSGATAHATVDPALGIITSITIDTAGSGYTTITLTVAIPTGVQKWKDFARGHERKITHRKGKQRITIDVGRDSDTDLAIMVNRDYTDGTACEIAIKAADILAIAGAVSAGKIRIAFREWDVCVANDPKKAVFLSSEPY